MLSILNLALETQNTTHRYTIFTKSAGFHDEGWKDKENNFSFTLSKWIFRPPSCMAVSRSYPRH